jgi:hypothetical protein
VRADAVRADAVSPGIRGAAFIAGAYEHPERNIPDMPMEEVHAEAAAGTLADAGLTFADVDGYCCAGDAPGFGGISMTDYLDQNLTQVDTGRVDEGTGDCSSSPCENRRSSTISIRPGRASGRSRSATTWAEPVSRNCPAAGRCRRLRWLGR